MSPLESNEKAVIDRAMRFSVNLRISPDESLHEDFMVSNFDSPVAALQAAKLKADDFNGRSLHGRQAIIYAVNPEGRSAMVSI